MHGISDIGKAGKHRLKDAEALMDAVRWRGAMYLAGYTVECMLKEKLMRMFDCRNMEELSEELLRRGMLAAEQSIFTHQLEFLLRLTNGSQRMRQNIEVWRQFIRVNRWVPAWRYSSESTTEAAHDFLQAVRSVSKWIENNV